MTIIYLETTETVLIALYPHLCQALQGTQTPAPPSVALKSPFWCYLPLSHYLKLTVCHQYFPKSSTSLWIPLTWLFYVRSGSCMRYCFLKHPSHEGAIHNNSSCWVWRSVYVLYPDYLLLLPLWSPTPPALNLMSSGCNSATLSSTSMHCDPHSKLLGLVSFSEYVSSWLSVILSFLLILAGFRSIEMTF